MTHDISLTMAILIDAHTHIYPHYSLHDLLTSVDANMHALGAAFSGYERALLLTERPQENFYLSIIKETAHIPARVSVSRHVSYCSFAAPFLQREIALFPGYQCPTEERLEVHLLCTEKRITPHRPFIETLEAALDLQEGIVALPWSLGKWSGKRRKLVYEAIKRYGDRLWISEPALRPNILPPLPFTHILHGTDPLPLPNEERRIAQLVSALDSFTLDPSLSTGGLVQYLQQRPSVRSAGHHLSLYGIAHRAVLLATKGAKTSAISPRW